MHKCRRIFWFVFGSATYANFPRKLVVDWHPITWAWKLEKYLQSPEDRLWKSIVASKKNSTFSYLFIWLRGIMWYESKMGEHSTAWPMHIYFPLYDYRILTAWICVMFWKEIREVRKKLQTFPNHRKNYFFF